MYFISFRTTHTLYYQTLLTSVVHRSSHSERKVDSGRKEKEKREKERVSLVRDEEWGWEYMHLAWLFPNSSILSFGGECEWGCRLIITHQLHVHTIWLYLWFIDVSGGSWQLWCVLPYVGCQTSCYGSTKDSHLSEVGTNWKQRKERDILLHVHGFIIQNYKYVHVQRMYGWYKYYVVVLILIPRMSACSCSISLFSVIPPSTRTELRGSSESWFIASKICIHGKKVGKLLREKTSNAGKQAHANSQ